MSMMRVDMRGQGTGWCGCWIIQMTAKERRSRGATGWRGWAHAWRDCMQEGMKEVEREKERKWWREMVCRMRMQVGKATWVGGSGGVVIKKAVFVTVPIALVGRERGGSHDISGDGVDKGRVGSGEGFDGGPRVIVDVGDKVAVEAMVDDAGRGWGRVA